MKLLIADSHDLFAKGLAVTITGIFPTGQIHRNYCWQEVKQSLSEQSYDFVLLEPLMSKTLAWREQLSALLTLYPTIPICIVSVCSDKDHIRSTFDLGVKGYLCKMAPLVEVEHALLEICAGNTYLPPQLRESARSKQVEQIISPLTIRQQGILSLVAKGDSNSTIASKLHVTESTVKRHIYNICQVLDVHNRSEAVAFARELGLLA